MAPSDVLQRVVNVTARVLGLDPSEIEPGSNFVFDLGAESSQSLELVMAFEAEFDIEMDQEKAWRSRRSRTPPISSPRTCRRVGSGSFLPPVKPACRILASNC